jgi:hypothetical protein
LPIGLAVGEHASLQESAYARQVAQSFPQDFHEKHGRVPAVELYRRILAQQPEKSVTIISVGDLTNLAALLQSTPDKYSPLDGKALVTAKVAHYVCMGSRYPAETDPTTNRWGNFRTDPVSARYVVEHWPTQLTFTGGGKFAESMAIGRKITTLDPKVWPVSLAYQSYFQKHKGVVRHTADSIAVFVAVRGTEPFFKVVEQGHNTIDDIGRNAWRQEPDSANQRYTSELINPDDAPKIAALLEELAMQPPKAEPTTAE